ncbi:GNAT family N-acetyltransferase [Alicyclobacillus sp. SO9]|uniref:GNAT family N-acetyltransferase n=1 Tax=Alicyclobacillus sp. SO9 TaxID=2665646 RepID=UPI0018E813B3|nr:GNAT family N-acetyltransferase [Alicyclobacillus sp. SO9]QQE80162.1 GNAT family N-acetyltransferase [Alicyclobacillus sp. SO9]
MQIREMKSADLSAIARINVDTFKQTQRKWLPDDVIRELSYDATEERFRQMLSKTERFSTIFVAEDNRGVIGYAMCGLAREQVLSYAGELYGIYILPEYHGKGIGTRLMAASARYLLDQGITSLYVVVFTENIGGQKFYKALGGQWVYERAIQLGGKKVSETLYGWKSLNAFFALSERGQLKK